MPTAIRLACLAALAAVPLGLALPALAQPATAPAPAAAPAPPPLPTLITPTPAEGFDLAVRLARRAVPMMQRDPAARSEVRQHYSRDGAELIDAAQVVALHFQTVAAANNYWRPAAR